MSIRVIRAGAYTTPQDLGRPGFRRFGVPEGGAADRESARLVQALLGDEPTGAVLEWTGLGGEYLALDDHAAALVGAPFSASIQRADGSREDLSVPQSFQLRRGDHLIGRGCREGLRAYLGVPGGWTTEDPILGSRSSERRVEVGETLKARPSRLGTARRLDPRRLDSLRLDRPIRVHDGLDGSAEELADHSFVVDRRSDRRGTRLIPTAPGLLERLRSIHGSSMVARPSTPVLPGSIQFSGEEIIILGRAGGTMGGYPVVARVASVDLDRIGQAAPGSRLRFEPVSLDDARTLLLDAETRLSSVERSIRHLVASDPDGPRFA